jgi:hypothetical protein
MYTASVELVPDGLACPACGSIYLHHGEVTVYDRGEDAPLTCVTIVNGDKLSRALIDSDACGNPSSRRDGVCIAFWCEGCDADLLLTMAQHKGLSQLQWCWTLHCADCSAEIFDGAGFVGSDGQTQCARCHHDQQQQMRAPPRPWPVRPRSNVVPLPPRVSNRRKPVTEAVLEAAQILQDHPGDTGIDEVEALFARTFGQGEATR